MLHLLVLGQAPSGQALLQEAWNRIQAVRSLSVTRIQTTEEFRRESVIKVWFRKGGYLRAETEFDTDIRNPARGWTLYPKTKTFQSHSSIGKEFSPSDALGLEVIHQGLPVIGAAKVVRWHGFNCFRIELDGSKLMTKETKLYAFIDRDSRLPIGISANLGSVTQVLLLQNLKVNLPVQHRLFVFTPPKGWKRLSAPNGWKLR